MAAVPSVGRAAHIDGGLAPEADFTRALYERYANQIFRYCLHQLGSREEAEDAVQSTFLNAFRGIKRGVVPELESAWLFKIAHNVCLSRRRTTWRRGRIESPTDFDEELAPAPSRRSDELIGLQGVLERLPENQRRAILLREWQGLSYREIADDLELSQAAVETLIFRARRGLASGLERPPVAKRRIVRGVDLGNILAGIKSLLLGGGAAAKLAATVAVVGAGTVVAAAPIQHRAHMHAVRMPAAHGVAGPAPLSTPAGAPASAARHESAFRAKGAARVSARRHTGSSSWPAYATPTTEAVAVSFPVYEAAPPSAEPGPAAAAPAAIAPEPTPPPQADPSHADAPRAPAAQPADKATTPAPKSGTSGQTGGTTTTTSGTTTSGTTTSGTTTNDTGSTSTGNAKPTDSEQKTSSSSSGATTTTTTSSPASWTAPVVETIKAALLLLVPSVIPTAPSTAARSGTGHSSGTQSGGSQGAGTSSPGSSASEPGKATTPVVSTPGVVPPTSPVTPAPGVSPSTTTTQPAPLSSNLGVSLSGGSTSTGTTTDASSTGGGN